ncbi:MULTISPECIES: chlorophyll a/b-binding protein [unclassified Tolypothrix]|uniref:chlorophyll a/b-binding protein n=1 Tax=unclassified Tolypothrix TaxID=2649714 RepID=UPI0005EAA63D|nr:MULTISPECIES: chlorophyll a/b-binding protein [unclassified Tolypothrix]BAY63503.1 high light inducible protein [Calothrix brevissima NIES-22]BAY80387.1 high light inducible protein [Nostoc linckia NIES-25]BAY93714.1 high light inducible protein [Microchaete diplosiphon NIES-3275]EKF03286.1 HemH, ferrochelatase [Tolypothrix sp. PCC 7601]MBE9082554.1 chlorophyll A-B binding protein [Tolypothrix sp. LEGE 11397]
MQEIKEVKGSQDLLPEIKEPYYYAGTRWRWGFQPSAEIWNGRLAMIGFFATALFEILNKDGLLGGLFWGFFQ